MHGTLSACLYYKSSETHRSKASRKPLDLVWGLVGILEEVREELGMERVTQGGVSRSLQGRCGRTSNVNSCILDVL